MEAGDVIKRNMQMSQSAGFLAKLQAKQAACVTTTCVSTFTTCVIAYPDYETRGNVLNGMVGNGVCSTLCAYR
jgi:hypothetical protein